VVLPPGRDSTPEAVRPLLDKELKWIGELFRWLSYQDIKTSTVASRALGGLDNRAMDGYAFNSHDMDRASTEGLEITQRIPAGAIGTSLQAGSAHRRDAFQACEFMIDTLKTDVPFWKQEDKSIGKRWVSGEENGET
jgi:hypothetical protein